MKARAVLFRFGISLQRGSVLWACEEFFTLWVAELEQDHLPIVGTLCALVAAHQNLPSKGDVEVWAIETEKVISASAQKWRLSAHEFTDTVHRLGYCG